MFAIARYWEAMRRGRSALADDAQFQRQDAALVRLLGQRHFGAYESIHLHDPRGPLADSAVMAMANMYFRAGHYEDAAFNYDIIRKDYPKSKYQLRGAHLWACRARCASYQGPAL